MLNHLRCIVYFTNLEARPSLPISHPTRHRPDLLAQTDIHDVPLARSSLHHLGRLLLQVTLRRVLHQHALCVRRWPCASLERAFLTAINWRLACTRAVLQLYYVSLFAHSDVRFYTLSSSSNSSASSTAAALTTTAPSTTTATAHATNPNHPSSTSSTGGTQGRRHGTSPDDTIFDSPEDWGPAAAA